MRKHILVILAIFAGLVSFGQKKYWQQQANFTINVSLNDKEHSLDGFETIEYINNSPDTLGFIWFHIWPNAYKNDRTAFSEQLLKLNRSNFYFSKPEDKGFINRLEFKADNVTANIESDTNNIDIIKVILPKRLAPGKKTIISTPFHVQLPKVFSRGGYIGSDYQVTQWFPKPAVYDAQGWHPMPYLDQGEFYSEFGNFDVEITLPSEFLVASTGVLQDTKTLNEIKQNGKHAIDGPTKTWRFKENSIHDFAWFASKDFKAFYDTAKLASGKVIDVFSYYKPGSKEWSESVAFAKSGVRFYSSMVGEYPYSVVSVVQGAKAEASGGMEYPTITLITTQGGGSDLDATIVHEIGHNWFYGILASNERKHPWMDEGINTYYQKRYELSKYGTYSYLQGVPKGFTRRLPDDEEALLLSIMARTHKDQPIETSSTEFTGLNYGLISYFKASRWIKNIENELGIALFDSSMRQYYREWKFKHPYPADFEASLEKASGKDLSRIF
ncbi:MAG: hypothetical protein JWQ96_2111, partial [Segetibacter sp.]|nr:hypothetical protein [Segetibacter sp.]